MGSELKDATSSIRDKVTGKYNEYMNRRYNFKCLICFADLKNVSAKDGIGFLKSHEKFHAMKYGIKDVRLSLYNPFIDVSDIKTLRYSVRRV